MSIHLARSERDCRMERFVSSFANQNHPLSRIDSTSLDDIRSRLSESRPFRFVGRIWESNFKERSDGC